MVLRVLRSLSQSNWLDPWELIAAVSTIIVPKLNIFSMDPNPDLNQAQFPHPASLTAHVSPLLPHKTPLTPFPLPLLPHTSSLTTPPSPHPPQLGPCPSSLTPASLTPHRPPSFLLLHTSYQSLSINPHLFPRSLNLCFLMSLLNLDFKNWFVFLWTIFCKIL